MGPREVHMVKQQWVFAFCATLAFPRVCNQSAVYKYTLVICPQLGPSGDKYWE